MRSRYFKVAILGASVAGLSSGCVMGENSISTVIIPLASDTLSIEGQYALYGCFGEQRWQPGREIQNSFLKRLMAYDSVHVEGDCILGVKNIQNGFEIRSLYTDNVIFCEKIIFAPNGKVSAGHLVDVVSRHFGIGVSMDAWSDSEMVSGNIAVVGFGDRLLDQCRWLSKSSDSIVALCPSCRFNFSRIYADFYLPGLQFQKCVKAKILDLVPSKDGAKLRKVRVKHGSLVCEYDIDYLFVADPVEVYWDELQIPADALEHARQNHKFFTCGLAKGIGYFDTPALFSSGMQCANQLLEIL